jgi:uncharacterized protein
MTLLAREITLVIVSEFGPLEMLRRLADPTWFQAFGAVLGFDWHSSGVTTTACGALKEGLKGLSHESGLLVAGGKGATSRKTPAEIEASGSLLSVEPATLVRASKMSAKVDSAALQDGYQLYHHAFFYTPQGSWTVVQQGMNDTNHRARRYHWLSERVSDFVEEPHAAVVSQAAGGKELLNMVARESRAARAVVTELSHEGPDKLVPRLERLKQLSLPAHHEVRLADIRPENLRKTLLSAYEGAPSDFEGLLALPGVGAKTIRALSLIAELVYDTPASRNDPALFSFAHGGKDGFPYPVDREIYDRNIELLRQALAQAKVERSERVHALRRLVAFAEPQPEEAGWTPDS